MLRWTGCGDGEYLRPFFKKNLSFETSEPRTSTNTHEEPKKITALTRFQKPSEEKWKRDATSRLEVTEHWWERVAWIAGFVSYFQTSPFTKCNGEMIRCQCINPEKRSRRTRWKHTFKHLKENVTISVSLTHRNDNFRKKYLSPNSKYEKTWTFNHTKAQTFFRTAEDWKPWTWIDPCVFIKHAYIWHIYGSVTKKWTKKYIPPQNVKNKEK